MKFLSLSFLIFSPLIFVIILLCPFFPENVRIIRRSAKGFAFFHLMYSLLFILFFNQNNNALSYYTEINVLGKNWIEPLGVSISFGVDGISLLLVVLTSFLFFLALFASKKFINKDQRLYYSLILIQLTAILGVFCARDMFLFFLFWEMELVPMYFLIRLWGSGNAKQSAMKFLIYTFSGSIFILFGILCLYFSGVESTSQLSGRLGQLEYGINSFPIWFQYLIFICFLIGFGVKLPIFPFHTWLPVAHTDAPTPVSMILAGILLKMGAYGLIRFNIEILPAIFEVFAPMLLFLGVLNILYSGIVAFAQKDIKKIIAYSSISHMGLVLVGFAALNEVGFNGALFQLIAHGVISAGLFMLVGIIYLRTKTRIINQLGGFGTDYPFVMICGAIFVFASCGVPLLIGFPAEFLSILGIYISDWGTGVRIGVTMCSLIGLVLTLGYLLKMFHMTFWGEKNLEFPFMVSRLKYSEITVLSLLTLVIIFFGLFPMKLFEFVNRSLYLISSIW